ncbi:rhamnogalacturonan acetylesterase [Enterococcus sp. DIV0876]|uniref:rhamnogalacturonan acetylesterase n=1 Tax=Enterococcus sp. DIV0876 TaxID=2774633 RepID=UPI003D2FA07F
MPKIVIAGDSTAANKFEIARPETGWGEKLSWFLPDTYQVINFAKNGASTKSFIKEGLLAQAEAALSKGDYFLIQFGHNDQKITDERGTTLEEYQHNLAKYIQIAKEKAAIPILFTSITRLYYDEDQLDLEAVGGYPAAMRAFAEQYDILCLDIFTATQNYFNGITQAEAQSHFLHLPVGVHPNYPNGIEDNTHLNAHGATVVAQLIAQALKQTDLPCAKDILTK